MSDPRPRSELLQRVLSASAALVAVSALLVSMYQTKIMREQQRMSAWPYVHLYGSNMNGAQMFVQNVGLGPALVRTYEVSVDGRPVRSYGELLRAVTPPPDTVPVHSTTSSDIGVGTVLLPGVAVETYRVLGPPALAARVHEASMRDRIVRRVCYCSLYEECWIADSHAAEPARVAKCAIDSARAFGG